MKLISAIIKPFKLDEVGRPFLRLEFKELPSQKSKGLVVKKAIQSFTVEQSTLSISYLR